MEGLGIAARVDPGFDVATCFMVLVDPGFDVGSCFAARVDPGLDVASCFESLTSFCD